ncbi:alpha/beta fold hydrolase [Rhizobium grahamii]|uniref:Alpha/beta hydrolase n=1 Tax=Rhizobium grahamii TaxID=1120045 RepID=A0A370KEN1_9HYPH|nr:alpha/beta hydrolase [Rhizobium grahamii]RDJ02675.1 alpha/beta hydrolase [Rhizobium grahamii]
MKKFVSGSAMLAALLLGGSALAASKPTVVLVHGAFAESASWDGVAAKLLKEGYPVVAVANPLRGLKYDSDYVSEVVKSIKGPIVLVGHSYGGSVISDVAIKDTGIKSLVFVSGLAPEKGESVSELGKKFPGSTLGGTLAPPVLQPDGKHDLYIDQSKFWKQFAADVPKDKAALMGAEQRPIAAEAFEEPSTEPAWKSLPSHFIYGSEDKNLPPALHAFMAKRANAKEAVEVKGSSHVVMISHPDKVAAMIERAAAD